ncbi:MAG: hypothetical protein ABSG79_25850, partial [Bryobacteraceae bacterium]
MGWLISICIAGSLASAYLRSPIWLLILLSSSIGVSVLLYLFAYLFCLFKDRPALRSERYSIQRLAIEKGFVGDTTAGIFRVEGPVRGNPSLPSACLRVFEPQRPQVTENTRASCRFREFVVTHFLRQARLFF